MALSITGTYSNIGSGSLGTTGPITGLVTGLGEPLGSSLVGGVSNVTTLRSNFWSTTLGTGVTAGGFGTRADNASSLTPHSSSNVFAQGQVGDSTRYLDTHWAAAFSNAAPRMFLLSGDEQAFLFFDGELLLDDGGLKAPGAPVATAFALTRKHGLDLFFADVHVRQSGPEPARLLVFGVALVGLGALVRRRMRGAATPNV